MSRRGLLLVDGPSDLPLAAHIVRVALRHGIQLSVTAPDLRRLAPRSGRSVEARLRAVFRSDDRFDVVFVHRDAEAQDPERRYAEVRAGVDEIRRGLAHVAVVPIRMMEAWLLIDEQAIRRVAGRPTSTVPLGLPDIRQVETLPDPKATLARVLEVAAGYTGRRRERFIRDFGQHRRLLLERLDHSGPVTRLEAWRRLEADIAATLPPQQ